MARPLSMRWVYAALGVFVAGFALLPPRAFLVVDEERYASQAVAFAHGGLAVDGAGVVFPATHLRTISDYPPGTALLQTPFVWAGGWRAAALLSVVALVVMTLATARMLRDEGRSPAFALCIPGFFGAAFFGRIAMSDVPSGAIVAVALWLLWRGERNGRTSLTAAAAFLAGASLVFRETLVLLLLPPLIASAWRSGRWVPAVLAGVAGALLRLVLSQWLFGSPLYVRSSGYGFSIVHLWHTVPVYAVVLLGMFPLGALLPFFYRGAWRGAVVTAVALYVAVFLFYGYDSVRENGLAKGVILGSRFMIPALPLLVLMAADVWPRWMQAARVSEVARARIAVAGAATVIAMCAGVHAIAHRQEGTSLALVRSIYQHTRADMPVITNTNETLKYLSPSYGPRRLYLRYQLDSSSVVDFSRRLGPMSIVLLDRNDSDLFRREQDDNERFLAMVRARCALHRIADERPAAWARVRVFELSSCG
ncbi:MAG TPA: hypothetical protein VJ867_11900 [Gemmatimonadaceae bacterium]|nr:hypothetical protein [Gemmatimonadaceae bacterium]